MIGWIDESILPPPSPLSPKRITNQDHEEGYYYDNLPGQQRTWTNICFHGFSLVVSSDFFFSFRRYWMRCLFLLHDDGVSLFRLWTDDYLTTGGFPLYPPPQWKRGYSPPPRSLDMVYIFFLLKKSKLPTKKKYMYTAHKTHTPSSKTHTHTHTH